MSKWYLLLTYSLLCQYSFGQFNKGYIITQSNDTLRGSVLYTKPIIGQVKISLKVDKRITRFNTYEVKGFGFINGKDTSIYQREILDIENSPFDLSQLNTTSYPVFIRDTVFVQLLVKGRASLYLYNDRDAQSHFFIQTGDSMRELVYRRYMKFAKGGDTIVEIDSLYATEVKYSTVVAGQYMVTQRQYRISLMNAMYSCETVREIIKTAAYNEIVLTKIFTAFNACIKKEKSRYVHPPERLAVGVTGFGGLNMVWLKFKGSVNNLGDTKFKAGLGYIAGASLNLGIPRTKKHLWINIETSVSGFKAHGSYSKYDSKWSYKESTTDFSMLYLKVGILPAYYFAVKHNISPYITAGPEFGFLLQDFKNTQHQTGSYYTLPIDKTIVAIEGPRKTGFGFGLGCGVRMFKIAAIEARYDVYRAFPAILL